MKLGSLNGANLTQLQSGGLLPDHSICQGVTVIPQECLEAVTGTDCKEIRTPIPCLLRALRWNHFLYTQMEQLSFGRKDHWRRM